MGEIMNNVILFSDRNRLTINLLFKQRYIITHGPYMIHYKIEQRHDMLRMIHVFKSVLTLLTEYVPLVLHV